MPRYAEILCGDHRDATFTRASMVYVVETNTPGTLYHIAIDADNDVSYRKSTNFGVTWENPINIHAGTAVQVACFYDKWAGLSTGLIHVVMTDSATADITYRTIDTASSDALSTATVVFAGASAANGASLSVARSRGGNVYCAGMIDAGVEGGFFRLPNANVPNGAWDAARTTCFEAATNDLAIVLPGYNADNQDMHIIFWDASADEISVKRYDDSANTQTEASIWTGATDLVATTAYPNFHAAADTANSRNVVIGWNGVDTANADLKCSTIQDASITAKTDVVLNSTDDQGLCGISIYGSQWWVHYCGKSDGSETWPTSMNVYYKVSTDTGSTWGTETKRTTLARSIGTIVVCPNAVSLPGVIFGENASGGPDGNAYYIAPLNSVYPGASGSIGI